MVRYRLISRFLSKVGIDTGQLTWQERQAVQDQSVSSCITFSISPSSFFTPLAQSLPFAFQVLDELLRRERFLAQVGRTAVLAAAAARAGIEVEDLSPREAVDLVDAELFCGLEVLNRSDRATRGGLHASEHHVERRRNDVQEPAEYDVGYQAEREDHVRVPEHGVGRLEPLL